MADLPTRRAVAFVVRILYGRAAIGGAMLFTFEFFRIRLGDDAHAVLDRVSQVAPDIEAAKVRAK